MAVYLSFFILLIGFACLTSTSEVHNCKSPRHAARAQEYFDQGNLIWTEGQKPDSIPFYRAAVRLCPESATYWLTLGTAEQFAGDKVKADGRFRKSQQILGQVLDLDDVVVGSNTDSIQTSTSSSAASAEIPTLTLEKVMQSHFSSPFVITNAVPQGITHSNDAISHGGTNTATDSVVDNLDMLNVTQLFTYLHTQYGDEPVEFYPQNMLVKPFRMYKSTIAEALDYLAFPDGAYVSSDVSEAGAYVQLTLSGSIYGDMLRLCGATRLQGVFRSDVRTLLGDEEADDVDVEKFYATTHWYMMLIGETGAGIYLYFYEV
ncbi:hypothetical protein EON65_49505 [archaeon]|nr:MAG: hypothetical protein EON65_49505 [archaeon]